MKAPYQPVVSSEISNENFDEFQEEEPFFDSKNQKKTTGRKLDMNFIGYTYKGDVEQEKMQLVNVLKELDGNSQK